MYNIKIFTIFLLGCINRFTAGKSQFVGCGSVVKLFNPNHKIRLHSHDVRYGSGSGQQSVTGTDIKEDVNSYWALQGVPKLTCKRGEPLECGAKIRLKHTTTGKYLHSHLFSAPMSGNQEVSAFGGEGETSDSGDFWVLVCEGEHWSKDKTIMLRHVDTDKYLTASGHTFGRPIHGQMEICGTNSPERGSKWQAMEGMYVLPSETSDDHNKAHTEL